MLEAFGYHWADPYVLVLVPALLYLGLRRRPVRGLATPGLAGFEPKPSLRARLTLLPRLCATLSLVLFAVALARPQERGRLPLRGEGIDIFLCLDLSSSMRTEDMEQGDSRIAVVKEVARRFVEGRPGDRIGLAAFALYPDLVCPPTLDHPALLRFLEGLEPKIPNSPEDRTGIGAGLLLCVEHLEKGASPSKVVILLTDGMENVNYVPPEKAAARARDAGVRVYAIGAGRGIQDPFFGFRELDFSLLERVAKETGGAFFRARDKAALERIFARIDKLERRAVEEPVYAVTERFFPFALAGLLLALAALLARSVWPGGLP